MPTLDKGLEQLGRSFVRDVQNAKATGANGIYKILTASSGPGSTPRSSGFLAASWWPTASRSAPALVKSKTGRYVTSRGHLGRLKAELRGSRSDAFLHNTADYLPEVNGRRRFVETALARAEVSVKFK